MCGVGPTLKSNQSPIDFEDCWSSRKCIYMCVLMISLHTCTYPTVHVIYSYGAYQVVSSVWGQLNWFLHVHQYTHIHVPKT